MEEDIEQYFSLKSQFAPIKSFIIRKGRSTHFENQNYIIYTIYQMIMSIKPKKLQKGDTVAIVSPSWGGPSIVPHVYEDGIKTLEDLGLEVKEYPSARKDDEYLYKNPEFRAQDINEAFAEDDVKAIFVSI